MTNNSHELLCAIALTQLSHYSLAAVLQLYRTLGSAKAVIDHRHDIRDIIPDARQRFVEALSNIDDSMKRAEMELEYDLRNGIKPLTLNDADYPQRLKECADAPLVLFYKGSADLNALRVVNIVGTRHCTTYGQDLIRHFVADLQQACPGVLIVSGLAYGVDICAHREALKNGCDTVGVLAHGLDTLYPSLHRDTAERMIGQGGLLTEFLTHTNADKRNFVQRNRIVAGMSDACVLVESAAKGGGLITARMSREYNREVFAFPGAVGAEYSAGCNKMIRENVAELITSAEDFITTMAWNSNRELEKARQQGIERDLFPRLEPDEQRVVNILRDKDYNANMLAVKTEIPIARLSAVLFGLEMKGLIRQLAGGVYHLL